jgi:hypothetical protein
MMNRTTVSLLISCVAVVGTSMLCAQTKAAAGSDKTQQTKTAKQKSARKDAKPETKAGEKQTPEQKPVFENDKVRVFRYELAPGVSVSTGEHATDHLLIPIGDVTVAIEARQRVRARSGEVQILKRGGKESVTNTGTSQAVAIYL